MSSDKNSERFRVSVTDLKVHFPIRAGVLGKVKGFTKAVDGVSFSIKKGEIFAIVGESGCGKTTVAQTIMGLVPPTSGQVRVAIGERFEKPFCWSELKGGERKNFRKQIQMVFQDPYSSLNPRMTVRSIVEEPLIIHKLGSKEERTARVSELLEQVGLALEYLDRYPHEFSGGQRQRVCIARALATSPEVIVADEPVSALDVSIQAQIINLLQDLQRSYNQTMLFISHDLAVVRHIADKIAVMYKGQIVETGNGEAIFSSPKHEYTKLLLSSIPKI